MSPRSHRKSGRTFACPHCGAEVNAGARACPECGADDTTGWSEDAGKWAADIPTGYGADDEFNYEEFVGRNFPRKDNRILGIPASAFLLVLVLVIVGALVVLAFVAL